MMVGSAMARHSFLPCSQSCPPDRGVDCRGGLRKPVLYSRSAPASGSRGCARGWATAMADNSVDRPTIRRQGLFPCEGEIARRLSQSEKRWRQIVRQLEREGLPKIDPIMGGRFWPAVVAFFRNRHGVDGLMVCPELDGEEHWNAA